MFRVYNILSHESEYEKLLYEDTSPTNGFVLLPDLKWDLTTAGTLYLVAIVHSKDIKSLRDLRKSHINMLKSIRRQAIKISEARWGVSGNELRMFVHYQPSYC